MNTQTIVAAIILSVAAWMTNDYLGMPPLSAQSGMIVVGINALVVIGLQSVWRWINQRREGVP